MITPARIDNAEPRPLGAPSNWDESKNGHCGTLFIRREKIDGVNFMRSAWDVELAAILRLMTGAKLILGVAGFEHPVVHLVPGELPEEFEPAFAVRKIVGASGIERSLAATGFQMRAQIIWAKQHFVISRGDYHWQHEPCWYAVRKGKKGSYYGDRKQSTVWEIPNASAMGGDSSEGSTGHGTQKPIACMRRPIENNSKRGEAVYEPFSGSGTTIIAAEQTGRRCLAVELDPSYVDVAVLRWQQFADKEATLKATGQTFAEVAREREAQTEAA